MTDIWHTYGDHTYRDGTPIVISDLLIGGTHNSDRIRIPHDIGHSPIMSKKIEMQFYQPGEATKPMLYEQEMYERRTARYCWDAAPVDHFVIQGLSEEYANSLLQEHQ
jgi:hypothetical protein